MSNINQYDRPETHNLNPNIMSWLAPRGKGAISRQDSHKHSISVMAFMDDEYPTTRELHVDEGGKIIRG